MTSKFSIAQMQRALSLAQSRRGFCAPNPPVGAVITQGEQVLATGAHFGSGHPHAEIEALKLLNYKANGAILYVTLEPCCHFGKTPPCTDQIIKSGIREVYFGLLDPNPIVAGKGIAALEKAGIRCELIDLAEIHDFYASYIFWTKYQRPVVTAKIALSLDGKMAGPDGAPIIITGPQLQRYTHENRKHSDAILSTINTVIKDDPQFNARIDNEIIKKPVYILDSKLRLPSHAKILQTAKTLTIFHGPEANEKRKKELITAGVRCEAIATTKTGLNLNEVLACIGRDGIHDLWVEAGGKCFQAFLQEKLINRALIYVAPKILGDKTTPAFTQTLSFAEYGQIKWSVYGADSMCEIIM
jgi:diaminohydroxyphosphoribosylaminopyrimidine deaminase/5-amino-6-(5-phosphoribosylamino)uracil reductase